MKRVLVRYKIKAGQTAENEALVQAVFEELAQAAPPRFRYSSLKLEDGVTFVHIMEADAGGNPLANFQAFKRFAAEIRDRCEDPPVATEFTAIGAYDSGVA